MDTNKKNLDDRSTNEMTKLINASIADMKDLKREVEQLVKYARKGFRSEKALNRDTINKMTSSQSWTTKEIADMKILMQSSQAMQLQVIDELTVKFQNMINNLTHDFTVKFDENKAETQMCYNKLTSVEEELENVTQAIEDVEKVAGGNKNMIASAKNRINEKLGQAVVCDDQWDRFLDHCYYFSSEKKTWDQAMEYCQNNNGSLLEIDSNEEIQFILGTSRAENYLWVGAHDRVLEGQFIWQTSKRTVHQDLWYENEPNNSRDNEDCVEIYKHRKGKLNDKTCSRISNFVCEKQIMKIF